MTVLCHFMYSYAVYFTFLDILFLEVTCCRFWRLVVKKRLLFVNYSKPLKPSFVGFPYFTDNTCVHFPRLINIWILGHEFLSRCLMSVISADCSNCDQSLINSCFSACSIRFTSQSLEYDHLLSSIICIYFFSWTSIWVKFGPVFFFFF